MVIRDPLKTQVIIDVAQSMAKPERFKQALDQILSIPGAREILEKREPFPKLNLDDLLKLPSDTLGFKYATHMKTNNLDPDFYDVSYHDDISYTFYRYGKVHDLWHVTTGYDTTIVGEIHILSFTYAQTYGPGSVLIIALALLHGVLLKPSHTPLYYQALIDGWNAGRKAKPLFTVDWLSVLPRNLSQVRQELHLE